jgi:hypothetical protein
MNNSRYKFSQLMHNHRYSLKVVHHFNHIGCLLLTFFNVLSCCGAPPDEGAAAGLRASREGSGISTMGAQRLRAAVVVPDIGLIELCVRTERVRECPPEPRNRK